MCGIAGLVSRAPISESQYEAVVRMQSALVHRGPDGAGIHRSRHAVIAMRRLSIIDLATGWQPLYNETGNLALVANGEIYNYRELQHELKAAGHVFNTASDSETALHCYEAKGIAGLCELRGMFAIAIWDEARQRLTIARDRMGEKPLYTFQTDRCLLFASEMKSLLASGYVPKDLNPQAIQQYFFFGYVPEPATPLAHVTKLPAGHVLSVEVPEWRISARPYWSLSDSADVTSEPMDALRPEFDTVSRLTIRSDVPVGVALSGGLDSSLIACMAQRHYDRDLHAFTVGYSDAHAGDETEDARQLAEYLRIPFHPVLIDTQHVVDDFKTLVRATDDPIADIAGYGYFRVMKAARDAGIPVMLSGQGGDELFWGYEWVREAAVQTRRLNEIARGESPLPTLAECLKPTGPAAWSVKELLRWVAGGAGIGRRLAMRKHLRGRLAEPDIPIFYEAAAHHDEARYRRDACRLLGDSVRQATATGASPAAAIAVRARGLPPDIALTQLICATYLIENGLAQADRLSMWWGVESRAPLVDYRLAEVVIGLRRRYADLDLPPKAWLREVARDYVPEFVMTRRKRGFTPPVRRWLREIFKRHGSLLRQGRLVEHNVLTPEAGVTLSRFTSTLAPVSPWPFAALVLEVWMREILG